MRRTAAVIGTAGIVSALAVAPAIGASTDSGSGVKVVNTETVQVYMSPDGKIDSQRVYEQLALSGKGKVDIANPVSTSGLRNLDGFGGFTVKDGKQIVKTTVDGETKLRSVSDFKGQLPLDVKVAYELDGKPIGPNSLVGKSGHLKVTFTVDNVTGKEQQVSVPDGKGGTTMKTEKVVVPFVGSLDTGTPASFTNVKSGQANLAGDGEGGTKLSFTMTLFPPIGSPTATFGYEADVKDAIAPRVEVSALPINPLESPTFASAATSYQGGADTGAKLVDGASQIDANLLKLRDGASQLVAGLIQLRDGAGQLSTGLNNDAVPGSKKLADGAGQLSTGLGQLDTGAGQLSAGAGDLADGTGAALAGGTRLTTGLKQISGGLDQLAAQLPGASNGITQLKAGMDQLIAGFGSASQPTTILGGLKALELGLGGASTSGTLINGATQLKGGLQQLTAPAGLPAAKGGVDAVQGGLDNLLNSGKLDDFVTALTGYKALCSAAGTPLQIATCQGTFDAMIAGLIGAKTDLQGASSGLGQVSGGLGVAIGQINTLMIPGATQLIAGLNQLLGGVLQLETGAGSAKAGAQQVRAGLDALAAGITAAVVGVTQLNTGAGSAVTGSEALTSGLGQLDAGAGKLSAGASKLAVGTRDAADGGRQVADGANQLSTGLGTAADGSSKLFAGLQQAAGSAPQLPEGAQRLSTEGMQPLKAAGESTVMSYGEMVSVMKAGAERAKAESMAYGAPAGATGLTAYSYIITEATGQDTRNVTRVATGAGLLAALGGLMFYRRRALV